MIVSHKTLKVLAAIVWYSGPAFLFMKGSDLVGEALAIQPESCALSLSWLLGISIGMVKTKFVFNKANRKNLARIDALESPRLWQFYRPRFFLFLGLMMMLGAALSGMAQGSYGFLVSVAVLDISIGTALLLSSWQFWVSRRAYGATIAQSN
ncbi:MAG: hypothetical protein K9M49_00180 [Candidatus Marinimicrobia bacterium]|nr:hypothetical protein [Candidatus Neomarinimicrobiota bacterium]MCF7903543.1 hypothetical protein [Candidatus Neomarinimicrobiota bacterium]